MAPLFYLAWRASMWIVCLAVTVQMYRNGSDMDTMLLASVGLIGSMLSVGFLYLVESSAFIDEDEDSESE